MKNIYLLTLLYAMYLILNLDETLSTNDITQQPPNEGHSSAIGAELEKGKVRFKKHVQAAGSLLPLI